jgi:D-xylose transport system permease protein
MATTQHDDQADDLTPGSVAVAGEPAEGHEARDLALAAAPEALAHTLPEYLRAWLRRIRSGESGALPVVIGLIALGAYFQLRQSSFLSASNIANLVIQAGWIITIAMAQVFILLLGEIDLSVGFNAAIGGTIAVWMEAVNHPVPAWIAILTALAVTAVISVIEALIIIWLRIPSFVVTLAGLLGLNGVMLYLYEETGSVGLGGVIRITPGTFLDRLTSGNISPPVAWGMLIGSVVIGAIFMIARERRRRAHNLVTPPLGITVLKLVLMAAVGAALVLVLSANRAVYGVLNGVPWDVPIVLVLLLLSTLVLGRTKFGRYVYAIGGNAEAARRAGINLSRVRVLAFCLCGVFAGITGILYASELGSMSNNFPGVQYVLYSVAGGVIGGVSLFGGRGRMIGAVLGGFVVAVIYNGVSLLGLGPAGQYLWTAAVLLAAVTLDALARRGTAPT